MNVKTWLSIARGAALAAILLPASMTGASARTNVCALKPQTGIASWYAPALEGSRTSSGEPYNGGLMTAAHMTLPMNTKVRVTNRLNGHSVILRINDRGPHVPGRLIDLSAAAADSLGMKGGMMRVRVKVLCPEDERLILLTPPRKPPVQSAGT